jgi:steroid delta-isomerase-like uncharacterized protein
MRASIAKERQSAGKLQSYLVNKNKAPIWRLQARVLGANLPSRKDFVPDNKSLVRRYYSEVWNAWSAPALEELISPEIVFRGSIGTAVQGIAEFRQYVNRIRLAFPDFHNHIEELICEGDKVAARLTYAGTHQGELFGFPGSGAKIMYQGLAVFEFEKSKIVRGFVLGDTETLKRQLGQK